MQSYDVIIIGAGPAGLCLARELSHSGLCILLLDRKKNAADVRYTTSGSFLDPVQWGLPATIAHPIYETHFSSMREIAVKKGRVGIVDRRKLLVYLESRAQLNQRLTIEYEAKVCDIKVDAASVRSLTYRKNGRTCSAHATIFADCSGISAVLAKRLELRPSKPAVSLGIEYIVPLKREPHSCDLLVGSNLRGGYGWIFPLDAEKAIIGFGTLQKEYFRDIEQRLRAMWRIERVARRCELMPLERHFGILKTAMPMKVFAKNNAVIIGDCAMQANPLVGEGIRFAMESSRLAAPRIQLALQHNSMRRLKSYSKEWTRSFAQAHRLAFRLQQFINQVSGDDAKLDRGVRLVQAMSDEHFSRLLSSDINPLFLARIGIAAAARR